MKHWLIAVLMCLVPLGAAGQEQTPRIFDVHLHAFPPATMEAPASFDFGPHRRTAGTNVTNADSLLRKTLRYMDEAGIRRGLVSGPMARQWAEAHPDRFLASFSPNPEAPIEKEVKRFERGVAGDEWRAVGEIGLPYAGRPLNDSTFYPLYAAAEEAGVPVFFHTGLDGPAPDRWGPGQFRVELGDPLLLRDVVRRFPDLDVVIAHMGWPFFDKALYMLYAYPNVHMDVAVTNWILGRRHFRSKLCEAASAVGTDRLLFGSDQMVWPQMIPRAVEGVRGADCLDDADRRRILWENAAELVGTSLE